MTVNKKTNSNQNKFFRNIPEDVLQETIPTMINRIIILLDRPEEQQDEEAHSVAPTASAPGL
ncbi:hypothetical protein Lbir_0669 [Legionella birminghamensis]|uniref:Uncharacterized protein n=1 Tax=Legionella birminghamensis TaxID=28083 RepID=A0A378IAI4_9GAMM|nr:hypothetical protein [Legionella birminghamensis]KTC74879.1 hypothetical protein Lbir_0669 [Legionella birminghamensis]STX31780.1 Uncharacterised protein [Legionella birminghamensis]